MIPSDHFVRFYNEVFKALQQKGCRHLVAYWRELGRLQTLALGKRFRGGGIKECAAYWRSIIREENCAATLIEHADHIELRMRRCPSLSKVLDNDASPFPLYCDHCMGWIEPVMVYANLHAVIDIRSRSRPECRLYVCRTAERAEEFRRRAVLPAMPYSNHAAHVTPRFNTGKNRKRETPGSHNRRQRQ